MSSKEFEVECYITGFKSGNFNTVNHKDYEAIETGKNTDKSKF